MKSHVNLLPVSLRYRVMTKQRLLVWSVILGMTGLGTIFACGHQYFMCEKSQRRLQRINQQVAPLRTLMQETIRRNDRIAQLDDRETILESLARPFSPCQLLGVVSRSAATVDGQLRVSRFQLASENDRPGLRPTAAGLAAGTQRESAAVLQLGGQATNDAAIARFVKALRESGEFANVELKSASREALAGGKRWVYEVTCQPWQKTHTDDSRQQNRPADRS